MKFEAKNTKVIVDGIELKSFNEVEVTKKDEPFVFGHKHEYMRKSYDVSGSNDNIYNTKQIKRFIVGTSIKHLYTTAKIDLEWSMRNHSTAIDPDGNSWTLCSDLNSLRGYGRNTELEIMVGFIPENASFEQHRRFHQGICELEYIYGIQSKSYTDYISVYTKLNRDMNLLKHFCKQHGIVLLFNKGSIILHTKEYKHKFGEINHIIHAIKEYNEFSIGYTKPLQHNSFLRFADIVYDKSNNQYIKHREIGERKANEVLEFCNDSF